MVESSQSLTRPDPGRNLTAPGFRSLDTQTKDYIRMSELQSEIRTKLTWKSTRQYIPTDRQTNICITRAPMELKSWRDNPSVTLGGRESRIIFQAKKYLYVINLQFPWLSSFRLSSSKTAKCTTVRNSSLNVEQGPLNILNIIEQGPLNISNIIEQG